MCVHAPVLGRVAEPRQSQDLSCWTCNLTMGLHYLHSHHTVHKRVLAPKPSLTQVPAIVLQCSSAVPEFTSAWLEFHACEMSYSTSLGWMRGYFCEELGQPERQFKGQGVHAYVCVFVCVCVCVCMHACVCVCTCVCVGVSVMRRCGNGLVVYLHHWKCMMITCRRLHL